MLTYLSGSGVHASARKIGTQGRLRMGLAGALLLLLSTASLLWMWVRSEVAPEAQRLEGSPLQAIAESATSDAANEQLNSRGLELSSTKPDQENGGGPDPARSSIAPIPPYAPVPGPDGNLFSDADKLGEDPRLNPSGRRLGKEEKKALRDVLAAANARDRELREAISIQSEAHARDLIARGEGRVVQAGEKVKFESSDHDQLVQITIGQTMYAVSFAKASVHDIAVYVDAREELIAQTINQIVSAFQSH